jgi:hypothetical protein
MRAVLALFERESPCALNEQSAVMRFIAANGRNALCAK